MKALRMVVALGLVLGMTLVSTQAQAAAKKKTKKRTATKTVAVVHYSRASKQYVDGISSDGHMGMFYTGAAKVPAVGHGNIALGVNYNSSSNLNVFEFPWCSLDYGVAKNFELAAGLPLEIIDPSVGDGKTGLGEFRFGGKYLIPADKVDFAVALDVQTGPLTKDLYSPAGTRSTDVNPKGLVTYKIPGDGNLVLNGEFGFVITGADDSSNYVQLKAGLGVPFSSKLTGIGELAINQYGDNGSSMAVGIRTAGKTKWQVMMGIGLDNAAPDFTLGGAVVFGI